MRALRLSVAVEENLLAVRHEDVFPASVGDDSLQNESLSSKVNIRNPKG
jgi:hypothetical protein